MRDSPALPFARLFLAFRSPLTRFSLVSLAQRCKIPAVMRSRLSSLLILLLFAGIETVTAQQNQAPHLEKRGAATQLIVDGKPFLILGGEVAQLLVVEPRTT